MKIPEWNMFRGYVSIGLVGLMAGSAAAEEAVSVTIKDIKIEDTVYTPYYEVQTEQDHQQGAAQKWIRLGVYFTTDGGWIDEIDVSQMAAIERDDAAPLFLSEQVHYINISPGDHYVYVYLHPSYVERYSVKTSDVDHAAVISVNGQVVASKEISNHVEQGWSSSTNQVMKSYLLNHAETPFWFINYDFKEIIKRENAPEE